MAEWLDGKKTVLAGVLVALLNGLVALGVKLPFDPSQATVASITAVLGVVVVLCRMFAKKPGVLAAPAK